MARSAVDLVSGEAEARDARIQQLRAELEASRAALQEEHEPARRIELLEKRVSLQEALIAELERAPQHGHSHGAPAASGSPPNEPHHEP